MSELYKRIYFIPKKCQQNYIAILDFNINKKLIKEVFLHDSKS